MVLMLRAVIDIMKKSCRFVGVIYLYNVKQELRSHSNTAIPRLTSDPANEFFRLTKIFFAVFSDSANECFSGCAR